MVLSDCDLSPPTSWLRSHDLRPRPALDTSPGFPASGQGTPFLQLPSKGSSSGTTFPGPSQLPGLEKPPLSPSFFATASSFLFLK